MLQLVLQIPSENQPLANPGNTLIKFSKRNNEQIQMISLNEIQITLPAQETQFPSQKCQNSLRIRTQSAGNKIQL